MKGNRTGKGYFHSKRTEPLCKKPLTVKLSQSMDKNLREVAGDNLADWVRDAIAQVRSRASLKSWHMNNKKHPRLNVRAN